MLTHSFNLGVRGHDFRGETLDELFGNIASLGIENIQFAPKITLSHLPLEKGIVTPELGNYIKHALDKHGLRVSVLGCYINPSARDSQALRRNIEMFKQNLMLAKYIGAGMVATETGAWETPELTDSEEAYQTLRATVSELTATAENLGVNIGIEPVTIYVINNCEKAQRLFSDINSDNLTLVFDPMNAIGDDIEHQHEIIDEFFDKMSSKISVIHLKDRHTVDGRLAPCPAGEGQVDFKYLFDKAKENKPFVDMILEETNIDRFTSEKERLLALGL